MSVFPIADPLSKFGWTGFIIPYLGEDQHLSLLFNSALHQMRCSGESITATQRSSSRCIDHAVITQFIASFHVYTMYGILHGGVVTKMPLCLDTPIHREGLRVCELPRGVHVGQRMLLQTESILLTQGAHSIYSIILHDDTSQG